MDVQGLVTNSSLRFSCKWWTAQEHKIYHGFVAELTVQRSSIAVLVVACPCGIGLAAPCAQVNFNPTQ
jgi:cation transport ATPase